MKKLNELSDGSCGRVVAINGDTHFQSRVTSIGLTIGCPFEVIQNPKKRPVLVYARDTMVAINKAESDKIMVEVTKAMSEKTIALLGQPNSGKSSLV
jgi:Fe2+ transport system protein A